MRYSMPSGCLALLIFAGLLLVPLFFANVLLAALSRLGLNPSMAIIVSMGIFFGSLVNIPVRRIAQPQTIEYISFRMFGLERFFPSQVQSMRYTVIAVNVGGCLVPLALVVYEFMRLKQRGGGALLAALLAAVINILVCYMLARPVPNVGIAMPALVPAAVAALSALLLQPTFAPPVAFIAGVLGPLVGADLLHLNDIKRIGASVASIGGAGTFDGIVISSLVATLIA
jgi:uncharacterized membrane protein